MDSIDLDRGTVEICFFPKSGSERDICKEEGLWCHSHLSRKVSQAGHLLFQHGCRLPGPKPGTSTGWWKERKAKWCLVCRERQRGVSRGGYQMVRSLGTIHHHHYLHQFLWTLTTCSAWLGREFEFLEKIYKSQTGLFRALICRCGRRQASAGALSLRLHKILCTHNSQPVPVQLTLLHQFWVSLCNQTWAHLSLWLVWGHCLPQASPAGNSSRERVTSLTLSMPGLTSPHRRQGCPALSHIKFSPAFSLPSLIVMNKTASGLLKGNIFQMSADCLKLSLDHNSSWDLLSSNIQYLWFAFGKEIRQNRCYFYSIWSTI